MYEKITEDYMNKSGETVKMAVTEVLRKDPLQNQTI